MEKWKITAESGGMDISELASAIMESWGPDEQQRLFSGIKQEEEDRVPMEDLLDPLESFSLWEAENFYAEMAVDPLPTLPEYDDMNRGDGEDEEMLPLCRNPTLAELNSSDFSSSCFPDDYPAQGLSRSFPAADSPLDAGPLLSKSFPAGIEFSPPPPGGSSSWLGGGYVPSGYIDIKQNVQPSLSSSCPTTAHAYHHFNTLQGGQFFQDKFPLCPQNSPASEPPSFGAPPGGKMADWPHNAPSSPLRVAQSNRFPRAASPLLSSSAPSDATSYFMAKVKSEPLSSSPGPRSVTERSLSGFSSLSLSNDDEAGSFFDDEEEEDDFSSDDDVYQYESDDPPLGDKASSPRKHRFFWQYNLQSRGAKSSSGLLTRSLDPHAPPQAPMDPVFHEESALPVKHSGKARRGDGNDLTPDPRKLHAIGGELRGLSRMIYSPGEGGRPLSRKDKNKLASRVCRLKKKAQHEANKIKLYGLQQEHKRLLNILIDTKELLKYKMENLHDAKVSNCSKKLETFLNANDPRRVAGNTATFVNEVLDRVSKGEADGGLGRL